MDEAMHRAGIEAFWMCLQPPAKRRDGRLSASRASRMRRTTSRETAGTTAITAVPAISLTPTNRPAPSHSGQLVWVIEMHVAGFRFDLAALCTESGGPIASRRSCWTYSPIPLATVN